VETAIGLFLRFQAPNDREASAADDAIAAFWHGEYSALLDRTRFNAVRHYLEETDTRLSQVAYLTGYTEPAALVRAFKRWTGETPSEFREGPRSSM
jgi:AraC-like DNA-binding protein